MFDEHTYYVVINLYQIFTHFAVVYDAGGGGGDGRTVYPCAEKSDVARTFYIK